MGRDGPLADNGLFLELTGVDLLADLHVRSLVGPVVERAVMFFCVHVHVWLPFDLCGVYILFGGCQGNFRPGTAGGVPGHVGKFPLGGSLDAFAFRLQATAERCLRQFRHLDEIPDETALGDARDCGGMWSLTHRCSDWATPTPPRQIRATATARFRRRRRPRS